jgi:hypothetical protein
MDGEENPLVKHVFGPVPSRRLGQSLGIDPVPVVWKNLIRMDHAASR